jgi:coenzyme F420 hydrogenase subunit beta
MPGGLDLKNDVLAPSACTLCGACLDWCPYLKNRGDHLVMRFDCNVNEGRCYAVCPRTFTDWKTVRESFLDEPATLELGPFKTIYKAKAVSGHKQSQNGGTVGALARFALKEGVVGKALLTGRGDDSLIPQPFLTDDADEVYRASGSRYLAAPGLRKLAEIGPKAPKVMLVGRPCQVQAARKVQLNTNQAGPGLDALIIGLFCLWSLNWSFKDFIKQRFSLDHVTRMDIPQHGIVLYTTDGVHTLTTEEVRPFIRTGCRCCFDMTSELADISVGSFEPDPSWNTLIIRSETGAQLVSRAMAAGVLQAEEYSEAESAERPITPQQEIWASPYF